jgi:polyhydroxyalkanoate synthesis repressor PhaR
MLLVKKYPNRRLYDTQESRYITLDDLETRIRRGADVRVQDASTGQDLTQETLTQIILERGGGRILPASLLLRLIRLDDEALAEFLTRYVGWALEVYIGAKQRAKALLPLNPLATAPFAATDAIARMMLGASQWAAPAAPPAPMPSAPMPSPMPPGAAHEPDLDAIPPPPPPPAVETEMEKMRRELDELKSAYAAGAASARPKRKTAKAKANAKTRQKAKSKR